MNPGTGFCEPASCIQEIAIRPLKEILARFFQDHPIVSHFSGECVLEERAKDAPHLVIFITSPPYCSEWTFGGLSLAVAAAMDGMRTTVVFIEDGVFALHGTHDVPENDKIFNIQEMIAVTRMSNAFDTPFILPRLMRGVSRYQTIFPLSEWLRMPIWQVFFLERRAVKMRLSCE
jgi:hypothetical protein